jgi:hypothetical protein
MMSAERTWRLVSALGTAAMIALVLGAYYWEATRDTQITSSSGDDFLKPFAESFFTSNIGGRLMLGPVVSAFAAGMLILCAIMQYFRGPTRKHQLDVDRSGENAKQGSKPVRESSGERNRQPVETAALACVSLAFALHFVPWGRMTVDVPGLRGSSYPLGMMIWWAGAPSAILVGCALLSLFIHQYLPLITRQQRILLASTVMFIVAALGFQVFLLVVGLKTGLTMNSVSGKTSFEFQPEIGFFGVFGMTILGVVLSLLAMVGEQNLLRFK